MLHDIKSKIQQYLSEDWAGFWWLLIPVCILPFNFVSLLLTGGGHASYFMYLPFVILYGPSLLIFKLEIVNGNELLPLLGVPFFQYLLYAGALRLSPPGRRWPILQVILYIHALCGLAFFMWKYKLIALYAFTAVVLCALLVWALRRRRRSLKIGAVSLLLAGFGLVPLWDVLHAREEFSRMCQHEAGIRVHKTAANVEGFTAGTWAPGMVELLYKHGYRYLEMEGEEGDTWIRYSSDKKGNLVREAIPGPQARYRMQHRVLEHAYVLAKQDVILDTTANEILATRTELTPTGGWFAHQLEDRFSREEPCGQETQYTEIIIPGFILKTLNPVSPGS